MLVYIIDGFNLVHRVKNLKNSVEPHCSLIRYIRMNKLTGSRNNKVIIVFDGSYNLAAFQERGDYELFFSQNLSADELIHKKLKSLLNKSQVVVVSDDREIRDFTKREGARSLRINEFIKIKQPDVSEAKDIDYSLQREITEEMRKIWLKDK
ncbi:MAG: NYN domain-containing protein [Candidatus Omnitrophica bacterium]|nr:NYN domain-containing protein [Candidatus Omnitrophota bacterium]MDD5430048.1 NYN domain-containing protein [Candidatus Omnitrophota bacterium]